MNHSANASQRGSSQRGSVHLCFRASKELQGVSVWLNKNLRQSTLQAWNFFYVNLDHLFKWNRFHLWYKPSYKYVSDGLIHQKLCNYAYESFLQIFHCLSTAMSTNKVDCSKLVLKCWSVIKASRQDKTNSWFKLWCEILCWKYKRKLLWYPFVARIQNEVISMYSNYYSDYNYY